MYNVDNKEIIWQSNWISGNNISYDKNLAAPYFRKTFTIKAKLKRATCYICGLGYNELYINGSKVGDEVLTPPFTCYDKTSIYNRYDITEHLNIGANVIGVILGNGMYNVHEENAWNFNTAHWRDHPKLIVQCEFLFQDETKELLLSDKTWKTTASPIIYNSLYSGEAYDARKEINSWCNPQYDDSDWENANICRGSGGKLKLMQMEPRRVVEVIKPIDSWQNNKGTFIYNVGKNITGWARIRVRGNRGETITIKYSEKLDSKRNIDQSDISSLVKTNKFQTDSYILKGEDEENWEPRFTYHGFQYIEVSSSANTEICSINACRVHTDLKSRGQFECSNDLINRIQEACRLSTLGNYQGQPVDCPHREKNGWTGDAALSAEQTIYNFDTINAYYKWLDDIIDVQRNNGQIPGIVPTSGWGYNWGSGPAWDSALFLIPWHLYIFHGDKAILEKMYKSQIMYMKYIQSMANNYIVDFGLGDWCPPKNSPDGYKCPSQVTDTAYYYRFAEIITKTALILGKNKDYKEYNRLAKKIKTRFQQKFIVDETGMVLGDCQTSYACVLFFGLADGNTKEKVINNLIKHVEKTQRHIDCGILGTKYILQVLTDIGRFDLAYNIATKEDFPSWGNWIKQGATTLWENWDGSNSRNHHMFSSISAWFYKCIAGINSSEDYVGFNKIIIKPNFIEKLTWVKASHECKYGNISVEWELSNNEFILRISIPDSTCAIISIPNKYSKEIKINNIHIAKSSDVSNLKFENQRCNFSISASKAIVCGQLNEKYIKHQPSY